MASGHVNRTYRGRTHGRTDQYCTREESPCQFGAVHTWPLATDRIFMADGRFGVRRWGNRPGELVDS